MKRWLILLSAALAVPTGKAEAQWDAVSNFLHVCVTGSLRTACGSAIGKTELVGGGTVVQIWVRNEQGGEPSDNTGGSFLTQIGLTAPSLIGVADLGVTIEPDPGDPTASPPVGEEGSPRGHWQFEPGGLGGQVTLKAGTFVGKDGALQGCDAPNGETTHYFITCDDQGYTGWVVFSFTTDNEWSADYAQIALKYQSIGDDDLSLQCRTEEVNGPHLCVVPEPGTWALLLTGMVGILGMGWLRRKQEEAT